MPFFFQYFFRARQVSFRLSLLGPILIGTHIAAFIGMTLGATKRNTTVWMIISIGVWTLAFGILTALGFDFFTA